MNSEHEFDVSSLEARLEKVEKENRWLRRTSFCALLLAAFMLVSAASGQRPTQTVVFGGQRLQPGMSKSEALARLAQCCRLSGSQDSFFVMAKDPSAEILGSIWFAGDKVSELRLDLGQFQDEQSVKLGLLLYRTLSEMTDSQLQSATVSTENQEMENGTGRTLAITLKNGRSLALEAGTIDPGEKNLPRDWVDVYEELR